MTSRNPRRIAMTTAALSAALVLSACSSPVANPSAGGIVVGTTDTVTGLDPAGAYDTGSNVLITNIYQTLMEYPEGSVSPAPSLATTCGFGPATTYECTIPEGLTFSNGNALTASDVAFSFNRIKAINDPTGPISLFTALEKAEALSDTKVSFQLKTRDQTWPYVIATASAAIVDEETFGADSVLDAAKVVGSGPYAVSRYAVGQQISLTANPKYKGAHSPKTADLIVQYYKSSSALKLAVEQGDAQVAYRAFDPADLESLRAEPDKAAVVEGAGSNLNFIGFNLNLEPGKEAAVRKAVASSINRQQIIDNVYNGVGEPLYSMVNKGFEGYTEAYKDLYGATGDVNTARNTLTAAGISTPVQFDLWWTPSHYGTLAGDEYTEISRQLNETGLFKVTLKSTEWQEYVGAALGDEYGAYQLGGSVDFPSALNALGGFFVDGGFLNNHFTDATVNDLAAQAVTEPDAELRNKMLSEIQRVYAETAPTIPLWQGKRVAVTAPNISGVEQTLDQSGSFRLWNIGTK